MSSKPDREIVRPEPVGPTSSVDACDLRIDHDLDGIRQEILFTLNKGQVLTVTVEANGMYRSVVCKTPAGANVGALSAFGGIGTLISCLESGRHYQVIISEIGRGRCHVVGGLLQS